MHTRESTVKYSSRESSRESTVCYLFKFPLRLCTSLHQIISVVATVKLKNKSRLFIILMGLKRMTMPGGDDDDDDEFI